MLCESVCMVEEKKEKRKEKEMRNVFIFVQGGGDVKKTAVCRYRVTAIAPTTNVSFAHIKSEKTRQRRGGGNSMWSIDPRPSYRQRRSKQI